MPGPNGQEDNLIQLQKSIPKFSTRKKSRNRYCFFSLQVDRLPAERKSPFFLATLFLFGPFIRHLHGVHNILFRLRLLGKYFFNNDLNCERFWFLFGINPDSDISKHRFIEVMTKTFEGPQGADKLWEKLWNYFDKGRGVLPVTALSHEMAKYELV